MRYYHEEEIKLGTFVYLIFRTAMPLHIRRFSNLSVRGLDVEQYTQFYAKP